MKCACPFGPGAGGKHHTAVVSSDGASYCFGSNKEVGQTRVAFFSINEDWIRRIKQATRKAVLVCSLAGPMRHWRLKKQPKERGYKFLTLYLYLTELTLPHDGIPTEPLDKALLGMSSAKCCVLPCITAGQIPCTWKRKRYDSIMSGFVIVGLCLQSCCCHR